MSARRLSPLVCRPRLHRRTTVTSMLAVLALGWPLSGLAQATAPHHPHEPGSTATCPHAMHKGAPVASVVNLSASAEREVAQDWVTVRMSVRAEAAQATEVQTRLRAVLDRALGIARPRAVQGELEVRSGVFGVYPRQGRDGRIQQWQGQAEVVLEGRDMAALSALAARLPDMTVAGLQFSLSRATAKKLEAEVQAEAIAAFRARAQAIADGFGAQGLRVREVSVGNVDASPPPVPMRAMAYAASEAVDASLPMEPGRSTVRVDVSGGIELR